MDVNAEHAEADPHQFDPETIRGGCVGDVSTLTWSEDYNATILDANYQLDGVAAIQLELIAHTEGATYSKVMLVVDRQSNFPLKAELYLMSGKLAKIAYFENGG